MEHPDYLLRRLTSRQLAEWMVYYQLQPFGQDVSDMMAAQIASLLFNVNKGRHTAATKPQDFLPQRRQEQTPEQIKNALRSFLGGYRKND